MVDAAPKLEIRELSVSYLTREGSTIDAVDRLSLRIDNKPDIGELAVFLGPSGCGKSTILRAVAGLLEPTHGEIFSDGEPVHGTSKDRGMVFQSYTSFDWLNVRENVEYGPRLRGVPKVERRRAAEAIIEQVGLKEFIDAYPKELSGGMKQRVAIARTLMNKPRLLLMDEPFGALDPQTRWGMQTLILDVLRRQDNTVLFVTHDVEEAVFLADTVFVLSARPAKVLHVVPMPYFASRDREVKRSPEFREAVLKVMELLYTSQVQGNIRVGL